MVEVCAIRAREEKNSTLVTITLHGRAKARLAGDSKHLVLLLPDAAAAAQLGANVTSGGLVTRFTLDAATPTNAEARLQMELSAPARAELIDGPDAQTVCLRLTPLEQPAPAVRARHGQWLLRCRRVSRRMQPGCSSPWRSAGIRALC